MLQFIIQGRGGQGAQTAGNILADIYFREGKQVLSYATYGGARRGTPVSSLLRVDDKPIRLRCDIEQPDVIACFDASLLEGGNLLKGATERTIVLINTALPSERFNALGNFRVVTLDAKAVAQAFQLGRIVNTTLVGAILGLLQYRNVDLIKAVVAAESPVKSENNVAACLEGYRIVNEGSRLNG